MHLLSAVPVRDPLASRRRAGRKRTAFSVLPMLQLENHPMSRVAGCPKHPADVRLRFTAEKLLSTEKEAIREQIVSVRQERVSPGRKVTKKKRQNPSRFLVTKIHPPELQENKLVPIPGIPSKYGICVKKAAAQPPFAFGRSIQRRRAGGSAEGGS